MSTPNRLRWIGIGLVAIAGANLAFAQHNWQRTVTVDPTEGAADHQTIQGAINDNKIGLDPSDRYTVLIYAGTYDTEAITLGDLKENVDLVGVDRDAVIIKPPANTDAITIEGFGARNNTIRNLTIITDDDDEGQGRGIVIKQPDQGTGDDPSAIKIIGVTIQCEGDDSNGLDVEDSATDLEIRNTRITTADGHGIEGSAADTVRITDCKIAADGDLAFGIIVGHNFEIISTVVTASGSGGIGVAGNGKDGVRIRNCEIIGSSIGLSIQSQPENLEVYGSEIRGSGSGVFLWKGVNVLFESCHIIGEGAPLSTSGIFIDGFAPPGGDVTLVGCRIEAIGAGTGQITGAHKNTDADAIGKLRLIDCDIVARGENENGGSVFGIGPNGAISMIGGSVVTSAVAEKETEVWDLSDGPFATIRVSGTTFSKWKGPIFAAGRKQSVVQRTIDVASPSASAILTATALTEDEQPDVAPTGQPDVYRVLSVTGNQAGMDQPVYIVGTDWAGNDITDKITLTGTTPAEGLKPFKTVDHIILPAKTAPLQSVSVGTASKLGLYFPISADGDVLQQGRKASGASSYTIESLDPDDVDAVYSTIFVETITADDSFEWAILASQ